MSSKAPSNRPAKYKLAPPRRSAALTRGVNKLKTYKTQKSTTSKKTQDLLDMVIRQYESRDILNIQTAGSMAHSLMNNNITEFRNKYADAIVGIGTQMAKQATKREATMVAHKKVENDLVRVVDRAVHRPTIKTKNWESESPTTEVQFVRDYKNFNAAWNAGYKRLISVVEQHLTKKQPNLKLYIGMQYTVIKQEIDHEDEDPEDVYMMPVGDPKVMTVRTKPLNIYNEASVKPIILSLRAELERKFLKGVDNQVGSNWSIGRIINLFANTHTLIIKKGSSYIQTPTRFSSPMCGLINIKNTDQRCFQYCMLYHQSSQKDNIQRIPSLDKIVDKYNYGTMTFPASLEDIQTFEDKNKLTINIFGILGDTDIITIQDGNVEHCRNDMVNLLLVEEGEQAHFIYVKKIERLMRTCIQMGYQDRRYCPYCRTGIFCKDETFEDHLMKKHYSTKNNCNLNYHQKGQP